MSFTHQPMRPIVMSANGMVSAGHPLAAQAGIRTLQDGGNAIDAAVVASAVLCVVDPAASGVGGDLFFLHYDARTRALASLNGSGCAAAKADPAQFKDGIPAAGPLSPTVPGIVRGWADALERFGTMSLHDALQPAIAYAEKGFPVSPRVAGAFRRKLALLKHSEAACEAYFRSGVPPEAGDVLRLPDLGRSLRLIAEQSADVFYEGELAAAMLEGLRAVGGLFAPADFAAHQSQWDAPLSIAYRGHEIAVQQPVSMGALLLEQLKIVEGYDIGAMPWDSAERLHLLIEAKKASFADLDVYLTDPRFSHGAERYLTEERARMYRKAIDPKRARAVYDAGSPASHLSHTTYLAVVDGQGNAVSWIQSVFNEFGSCWMAPGTGFVLNNRMHGFSSDPSHVNRLVGGKRTAHTLLAPMVLKNGRPALVLGTPGDYGQTQSNLQMIVNFIDHGMDVQTLIEAPRWRSIVGNDVSIENRYAASTLDGLASRGHVLTRLDAYSDVMGGAQAICIDQARGCLQGGADPRREGYAIGW